MEPRGFDPGSFQLRFPCCAGGVCCRELGTLGAVVGPGGAASLGE